LLWVSPPGDYAIVNSNHISDGTGGDLAELLSSFEQAGLGHLAQS
jgi:hypothetical protein